VTAVGRREPYDLVIIGGGINGCGIARDAAGRGLSVLLCEQGDLAQATSSASTKLFHGGLRYLEHYEFRLVREALMEREVLLRAMPHISWPLRFVLPYHAGLRPAWLLRVGLFIYDHLGGRKLLPPTRTLDLRRDVAGRPLQSKYRKAFEYSDCWVEDSRLVVLNARAAVLKGADVRVGTRCVAGETAGGQWTVTLEDVATGTTTMVRAKALVNASGPWAEEVIRNRLRWNLSAHLRLVRGSHIVVRKLFEHDRAYIFQNADGRIVFAIPYESDFTLIGTTDADHDGRPGSAVCTPEEAAYLCRVASDYFTEQVTLDDIIWSYSGVRPLYDDGSKSATAATRDYVLELDRAGGGAPLLNVFGGKITTYRRLAEAALRKLGPVFPEMSEPWTAGVPLPGGDFAVDGFANQVAQLTQRYPFLDASWGRRLVRAYGTEAACILDNATRAKDLGRRFGWNLTEAEVRWLVREEWARTADDVLWRRSKLGLRLSETEAAALADYVRDLVQSCTISNAPPGTAA
jgi:glycerol-3-phosphate dehydrogenase